MCAFSRYARPQSAPDSFVFSIVYFALVFARKWGSSPHKIKSSIDFVWVWKSRFCNSIDHSTSSKGNHFLCPNMLHFEKQLQETTDSSSKCNQNTFARAFVFQWLPDDFYGYKERDVHILFLSRSGKEINKKMMEHFSCIMPCRWVMRRLHHHDMHTSSPHTNISMSCKVVAPWRVCTQKTQARAPNVHIWGQIQLISNCDSDQNYESSLIENRTRFWC